MMDPKLRSRLKDLEIRARHLAGHRLLGEWSANIQGQGLEFRDLRDYVPGDDLRRLDWKATARTGRPQIRQFREDRHQTVQLALDLSASMEGGSKAQRAGEILAMVSWAAVLRKDRFALTGFSDRIEFFRPPSQGEAQLWSTLQDVLTLQARGRKTSFSPLLHHWMSTILHRSTCIILSDFQVEEDDLDLGHLKALAARHDLWIFHLADRRELEEGGLCAIKDSETGDRAWVDASSGRALLRQRYLNEEARLVFSAKIRKAGAWYAHFPVDRDPFPLLLEFLHRRGRVIHV